MTPAEMNKVRENAGPTQPKRARLIRLHGHDWRPYDPTD